MSQELVEAARTGNLARVDELLQNPDINAAYEDNRPLREAKEFRELLKKAGINTGNLSIAGDYSTRKYYVTLTIDEKEFTELMRLAAEKGQKNTGKAPL